MATSTAPLANLADVSPPPPPKVAVDEYDLALLRELATDARQSQRALARAIEMSPPAVADRSWRGRLVRLLWLGRARPRGWLWPRCLVAVAHGLAPHCAPPGCRPVASGGRTGLVLLKAYPPRAGPATVRRRANP